MGVLGYPKGSALELLDGALKLRHCTDLFTMRFLPWSLPRVGTGGGKRQFITPGLPQSFSSTCGSVRFLLWECLEPSFVGNRLRAFSGWTVQPKGASALALVRFNSVHACARIDRDTSVIPRSSFVTLGMQEHFVSGCWHSSGRDYGRYSRECC